jgi:hypothetical protein
MRLPTQLSSLTIGAAGLRTHRLLRGPSGEPRGVTEHEDHEKLADQLEYESDRMEQRSAELGEEISDAHDDWQRKRNDPGVPGAPPPADDSDDDSEEKPEDSGD